MPNTNGHGYFHILLEYETRTMFVYHMRNIYDTLRRKAIIKNTNLSYILNSAYETDLSVYLDT